jgi:hypothetical protein
MHVPLQTWQVGFQGHAMAMLEQLTTSSTGPAAGSAALPKLFCLNDRHCRLVMLVNHITAAAGTAAASVAQ